MTETEMWPYTSEERGWLAPAKQWASLSRPALPVQQSLPFPEAWSYANDDNALIDPKIFVCK